MVEKSELPVFKNNPVVVLILGFVTCGLYLIFWNMKMAEVFNAATGKKTISPVIAVLGGCCWPVGIYFYYLISQNLEPVGNVINKGEEFKGKGTVILILGIFLAPVAAMLVQQSVNEIYE